jgi:flagellar biosynthesis protein FliR
MDVDIATGTLVTFLLLSTRIFAVLLVAPPFNGGLVPVRVRLAVAVSIGMLFVSGTPTRSPLALPLQTSEVVFAVLGQVLVGLAFGFMIQVLLAAFQLAGSMIDLSAGLSAGALYDPMTQSQSTPVGRLFQMVSLVLLITLNGHLLILRGILRSFEAAPLASVQIGRLGPTIADGLGLLFVAALEIAFPVLAALTLAEAALAIATRAAPKMNILAIGFGVKSLVLLLVLALGLPLMANATTNLLDAGLRWGATVIGS